MKKGKVLWVGIPVVFVMGIVLISSKIISYNNKDKLNLITDNKNSCLQVYKGIESCFFISLFKKRKLKQQEMHYQIDHSLYLKNKQKMAKTLLEKGLTIKDIANITNLSCEDITQIK